MTANFLWYSGTSPYNGNLIAAVTLASTEMISLANTDTVTAATTFTSSYTGQGMWGDLWVTWGTSQASALSAGANIAGWWLTSPDGSTFESVQTSTAGAGQPRPPDWLIPMPAIAIAAGSVFKSAGPVLVPALNFKVFIQNNSGQTFSSSATANPTLKLAPYAMQY